MDVEFFRLQFQHHRSRDARLPARCQPDLLGKTPNERFGLHNLRHSLSTWLVNKGKVDPKTVQGMLRHSDIRTTMNLYTQDDRDEKQAAQGAFLSAVGLGSRLVQ
jgi:integrase